MPRKHGINAYPEEGIELSPGFFVYTGLEPESDSDDDEPLLRSGGYVVSYVPVVEEDGTVTVKNFYRFPTSKGEGFTKEEFIKLRRELEEAAKSEEESAATVLPVKRKSDHEEDTKEDVTVKHQKIGDCHDQEGGGCSDFGKGT